MDSGQPAYRVPGETLSKKEERGGGMGESEYILTPGTPCLHAQPPKG